MPVAHANGMELRYERFGDPAHAAILLIMRLGTRLVNWPDAFVARLVAAGFQVVRYDNRDVGLSTPTEGKRNHKIMAEPV